ncbi:C40 family peptidase [Frondihabitans cladoniiphilus]|uniref:NlpC/P60 domain-containing protein n=1 Tax=Frondihabitans cladoniiphilus TaxID=715785 RepID=A0ABP8VUY9_9MICO
MTIGSLASNPSASVARRSTPRTDPIRTGPISTRATAPVTTPLTRRAAREAERQAPVAVVGKRPSAKKGIITATVMTLTAGLIGTMALPAFALAPHSDGATSTTASSLTAGQTVAVADKATDVSVQRDDYTTTVPVVKAVVPTATSTTLSAAATTAAAAKRASLAASYAYAGPTASDYLANPAHPAFSLAAVYQTALQYVGTPYVFGGSTPAGFDCSGFVMFVYAQYGISLAHSVPTQLAQGTIISPADAQPGDVVVLDNGTHDGFYAGNGMILDAPKPGGKVSVRPLWTTAVHYVRFGIK